jgi:hypothetical protein
MTENINNSINHSLSDDLPSPTIPEKLTQKKIKLEIIFKKFIPLLSCIQKYLDGM